jgi:SAM-dependent methyltransferase
MSSGNDRFNAEAAAWDSNPDVHRASSLALQSLFNRFSKLQNYRRDDTTGLDVLEIGCGTGLLSFMLAPFVRSLTAVDTAQGIIDAFKLKLERQTDVQNVLPVCIMLEDPNDPQIRPDPLSKYGKYEKESELGLRRFNLIISHLVLPHTIIRVYFLNDAWLSQVRGSVVLMDFETLAPKHEIFIQKRK